MLSDNRDKQFHHNRTDFECTLNLIECTNSNYAACHIFLNIFRYLYMGSKYQKTINGDGLAWGMRRLGMDWLRCADRCLCGLYITGAIKGSSGPTQEKDLHNVEFTPGVGPWAVLCGQGVLSWILKESETWIAPCQLSSPQTWGVWGGGCVWWTISWLACPATHCCQA